jgi:hypothetical protein
MGAAGRARWLAHFTIERLTAEFLEEYERAIEMARARRAMPASVTGKEAAS